MGFTIGLALFVGYFVVCVMVGHLVTHVCLHLLGD